MASSYLAYWVRSGVLYVDVKTSTWGDQLQSRAVAAAACQPEEDIIEQKQGVEIKIFPLAEPRVMPLVLFINFFELEILPSVFARILQLQGLDAAPDVPVGEKQETAEGCFRSLDACSFNPHPRLLIRKHHSTRYSRAAVIRIDLFIGPIDGHLTFYADPHNFLSWVANRSRTLPAPSESSTAYYHVSVSIPVAKRRYDVRGLGRVCAADFESRSNPTSTRATAVCLDVRDLVHNIEIGASSSGGLAFSYPRAAQNVVDTRLSVVFIELFLPRPRRRSYQQSRTFKYQVYTGHIVQVPI
ncbi:hypothetical protein SODALDRAFT_375588 [Sodiomyces alkalinus F11]|uniref:Uncharacterized protein n=1 Tax=Sodiomyces alkalinus (strain CBS 110278 / VKM F-3762 / F11) TaxID=1314773 RepID=A0A3N2Q9G9_SODAK|nr:hypothetical protein SODALDRAFT_375588 [Sodiomyces alkalinus F11]ROT43409.1 hypothetical protein SODALDRAFT_375588 [Sodiomyces alkalinus F11]